MTNLLRGFAALAVNRTTMLSRTRLRAVRDEQGKEPS